MVKKIELEILAYFYVSSTAQNEKVVLESCRPLSACICLCMYMNMYDCEL
jgi:hypothetical protein